VYWDDIYLLYLKRGGRYDSVIQQDEYRFIKPAGAVEPSQIMDANYRAGLFRELKRNCDETGSSKAYAFLGLLFNQIGLYREAIESLSKVRDTAYFSHLDQAYAGIGYAYGQLGNVDESIRYYKKALSIRMDALILQNLGSAYALKGDREAAVNCYEKALSLNSKLTLLYPQLMALYLELGRKDDAERIRKLHEASVSTKGGEAHFRNGTKAYMERNFGLAVQEFQMSIAADPANPAALSNLGYVYYDMGDLDKAFECHRRALEIDRNWAASHYGLALLYKARGDKTTAIKHWQEYLRIEPSGYYSRQAKAEIESLRR
jgi:tetratricopeptide (TPR) repeat protein